MKILYEQGDTVHLRSDYFLRYIIVEIRPRTLILKNDRNELLTFPYNRVFPTQSTLTRATFIRPSGNKHKEFHNGRI